MLDWTSAEHSDSIAGYQAYLKKYGRGTHAAQARNKIESFGWQEARTTNTVKSYEDYLAQYARGTYAGEAQARIEELIWKAAAAADQISEYQAYVTRYGKGAHVPQARKRIEELRWHEAKKAATIETYEGYLSDYPAGSYVAEASQNLEPLYWNRAVEVNDVGGFEKYVENCPQGPHAKQAGVALEQVRWLRARADNTMDAYEKYLSDYPEGRFAGQARKGIEAAAWSAAENSRTDINLYRQYLSRFPTGSHAKEAQDCDSWARAEVAGTTESMQKYLEEWPRGRFVERARKNCSLAEDAKRNTELQMRLTKLAEELLGLFKYGQIRDTQLLSSVLGEAERTNLKSYMRKGMMRSEPDGAISAVEGLITIQVIRSPYYMIVEGTGEGKGTHPILSFDPSQEIVASCRAPEGSYYLRRDSTDWVPEMPRFFAEEQ